MFNCVCFLRTIKNKTTVLVVLFFYAADGPWQEPHRGAVAFSK